MRENITKATVATAKTTVAIIPLLRQLRCRLMEDSISPRKEPSAAARDPDREEAPQVQDRTPLEDDIGQGRDVGCLRRGQDVGWKLTSSGLEVAARVMTVFCSMPESLPLWYRRLPKSAYHPLRKPPEYQ